jgi:hypothetical protein
MRCLTVVALALAFTRTAGAQLALDTNLAAAFTGRWSCAGAFASGRPIEADLAITSELDGRWLLIRHEDRAPSRWRALALLGTDSAGVRATFHDNGGAPRTFAGPRWDGTTVRLESPPTGRRERFTYTFAPDASFDFAYEVSADGATWRVGDRLHCTRKSP